MIPITNTKSKDFDTIVSINYTIERKVKHIHNLPIHSRYYSNNPLGLNAEIKNAFTYPSEIAGIWKIKLKKC